MLKLVKMTQMPIEMHCKTSSLFFFLSQIFIFFPFVIFAHFVFDLNDDMMMTNSGKLSFIV